MTSKALISAQPWSPDTARTGLVDAAVAARGTIGDRLVKLIPEPLLKDNDQGVRLRSLRVVVQGLGDDLKLRADDIVITAADGGALSTEQADGPADSVRLLLPLAESEETVSVGIPSLGHEVLPVELDVPREWTVHLVHQSHLDIGYTDPQARILTEQRSYLDSALDLVRHTRDWPEESRFRWAVESLWTFEQWAERRPRADVDEFLDYVREGSIELTAMPYNLHTDTCSTDELHELLRLARDIRDRHGVSFTSAMQTDVPGTVVGLPEALNEVGVKYLSVAHNWAGRSMPHTNGGDDLPRLFRWKAPSGHSVLVWMTDSPHGLAYMEGPFLGFHDSYASVDDLFPAYLTSMAKNSYPYPPGVFGWHGDPVTDRAPYPWDILHLRTQGWIGDNAPARLIAPSIVREWNETWASPKLRMSRNEDFFADAEERLGDQIRTFEGDWGDWWVEGVGSAAHPQSLVRQAQVSVTDGQTLSSMARLIGGEGVPGEFDEAQSVYRSISLFNEHTWGASNSWLDSDEGTDSGELQWHWKVAHALAAQERGDAFVEHAGAYLGAAVAAAPDALASFTVANTAGLQRTATVRLFVRESRVPVDQPLLVRDARTGAALDHVVEPQVNPTHREAGRFVRVQVADVPALGLVRLDLLPGDPHSGGPLLSAIEMNGLPGAMTSDEPGDLSADSLLGPDHTRAEQLTLENEYLRVVVDERRACIGSIVELATGRELVNTDAVAGFNAYIYDTYTTAPGYNHNSNKMEVSPELELLGSRTLARPAVILERSNDGLEQRLVYEFNADGVDSAQVTLRLRAGEPQLLIENRLAKPTTMTKESAFFAFPFAVDDPTVRYEVSGGVTGDGMDHVPGAPQHMRAIRGFVTLNNDDHVVAWATKDAPLVHPQTIALPYAPFPDSTSPREPATLYSWVHNNVWDTNFPVQQGFVATFSYAIGVADHDSSTTPESLGIRTATELAQPLRVALATGRGEPIESSALFTLDDPRVRIVSVLQPDADDRGRLQVRLQSLVDKDVTVRLAPAVSIASASVTTYLGDHLADLSVSDDGVEVSIPRLSHLAVMITIAP